MMNELFKEMIMIIGSYLGVVVIAFGLINFLSAGFLITFIRVRASRGKLILVKVRGMTDHYFRAGKISEKTLTYKARGQKEKKRIPLPVGIIFYRSLMVYCLDIDEDTNTIITPDGAEIDTYDAEKYEQLIIRALYTPALMDQNEKIILLMLGICILGLIIVFFFVKTVDGNVTQMMEQIKNLASIGVVP